MKFAKKLMSVLLVVLMLATMALPAMAAPEESGSITINHPHAGHKYKAYQIFKGTLDGGILTNIEWGDDIDATTDSEDPADGLSDLIEDIREVPRGTETPLAAVTSAKIVTDIMSTWTTDDASLKALAEVFAKHLDLEEGTLLTENKDGSGETVNYSKSGLAPGYYLIKDAEQHEHATMTDYLLQIVGNTTVSPKSVNPVFEKTVNSSLEGTFKKALNVEVGEKVYFKLEAHMPSLLKEYKQFMLSFEEQIPDYLTNPKIEAVFIQHTDRMTDLATKDVDKWVISNDYYENNSNRLTGHLRVDFKDILETYPNITINDRIVVKYSAVVGTGTDELLKFGKNGTDLGNSNDATLYFTGDMNEEPDGKNETLKKPDGEDNRVSYATLTDNASIYSYGVTVTKVDAADKTTPLPGAEFAIYRVRSVKEGDIDVNKNFYAKFGADGTILSWAEHPNKETLQEGEKITTDADGKFTIKGLSAVGYYLEEVAAPSQYNEMDAPLVVEIVPTLSNQELTALAGRLEGVDVSGNAGTGLVSVTVENNKGTTLPATGGMGTTIFYIAGAVLLLGSITAFAVKKRGEN